MTWLWRNVGSPSAGDVIADLKGRSTSGDRRGFSLYGFFISHDATATKRYRIETYNEGSDETRGFITVALPPEKPYIKVESDEPLIIGIGQWTRGYYEHLRVVAIDGGEPNVCIGLKVKGKWHMEIEMFG